MKNGLTAYLFLFSFILTPFSQTEGIFVEQLSVKDGLLSSNAWAVAQDSSGYIWIGMDKGLARYDGYEVYNYSSSDVEDNGFSGEIIRAIHVDSENKIWVGSDGQGIFKLDKQKNRFVNYNLTDVVNSAYNSNRVANIINDDDGNIWAITYNGLVRIDKNTNEIKHFLTNENEENVYRSAFASIGKDKFGCFWLTDGYDAGELACFDPKEMKLINRFPLPDNTGYGASIYVMDNKLIIGTAGGYLIEYEITEFGTAKLYDTYFMGVNNDGIASILKWTDKKFLLGSYRTLYEYNRVEKKIKKCNISEKSEIIPNQTSISQIINDFEGNVWFTTDEDGLGKIGAYKNPFQHLETWPENSNKRDKVYGLEVDPFNNLWIGTTEGLIKFDQLNSQYIYFEYDPASNNGISNPIISSILFSTDNKLYIGTIGGGLNVFNPANENFKYHISSEEDTTSLNWDYIRSLYESKDGTIWIGSFGSGLEKLNRDTQKFYNYFIDFNDTNSTNARRIFDFAEDDSGNLWLATMMNGVEYFDRKKNIFKHFLNNPRNINSLSSNNITALYLEGDTTLWIGTNANGLNKYDIKNKVFSRFSTKNGLASNSISAITADNKGKLWLSTGGGISEFDPLENSFRNFTDVDGIKNTEFTPAAYTVDTDGYIYFGGDNGVTKFHPDSVQTVETNVKPVITKLSVIDRDKESENNFPFKDYYYTGDEIRLSSADYYFSIEFSAVSYVLQNKLKYAYKLEGFQDSWILTDHTNRVAIFTNLPPGDYTLRIAVLNEYGRISNNQIEKALIISPMFHQTAWFYILIGLVVAGFVYWIYRIKINKVLELENLRLKIASDLHDEVGSNLTKVSMRAQMLEMQINGEKESRNLKRISEQAREAVSTMQDIVWAIDSRNDEAESLINKMKDTAFSVLAEKNIKVDFSVSGFDPESKLNIETRQNLYLILKEAVHNIIKHSNATKVWITLTNTTESFKMKISDNGNCFNQKDYHTGQGLKNITMRSAKINGKVEFKFEDGFNIILTMPPIKK